jgi:hypothetical protein
MPVDLDSIPGSADRFEHAYDRALGQMQRRVERVAREERRDHAYHNRTGDLEASTQASEVMSVGDTDVVQLAADMPYASYVNDGGLMRIDERATEAAGELEYLFEGLADTARVT